MSKRYWRILLVEDQYYELQKEINKILYEDIDGYYNETFGRGFLEGASDIWNSENSFPRTIDNLPDAWSFLKVLHEKGESPDLSFFDIKLDEKKAADSESSMDKIKNEIIDRLWQSNGFRSKAEIELALEEDLFKMKDGVYGIEALGGIYLASLHKLLFPDLPAYLYTENPEALSKYIPMLMVDMYTSLYKGKFLQEDNNGSDPQFQWHNLLKKQMTQKLTTGAVFLKKILPKLKELEKFIIEMGDDMVRYSATETVKEKMKAFFTSDIGSRDEPGWTIGSFFVLFVKLFQIKSFEATKKGLAAIKEILNSIDYTKMFGIFIATSHFNAYSHANSQVFRTGIAKGYTPIQTRDAKDNEVDAKGRDVDKPPSLLLLMAAMEMQKQWEELPCSNSDIVKSFETNYIKKAVENGNNTTDYEFGKYEKYKDCARVDLKGIFKQIKTAIESVNGKVSLKFEYYIFSNGEKKYKKTLNNRDYGTKKETMGFSGSPEGYLPVTENGDMNRLGDLLLVIFQSIFQYGYENKKDRENIIEIRIKLDEITCEWKIEVIQRDGESFNGEDLKDEVFFRKKYHNLRDSIMKVKNWIRLQINSDGVSRDPHTGNWENVAWIDGRVQYELRISLVGE